MADTTSQALRFSATIQDETGTTAATPSYAKVDPAQTVTQLVADYAAWALALDALTDGVIRTGRISIPIDLTTTAYTGATPPLKTTWVEAGRVEQTGVLNFSPAAILKRWGQVIPAIADSLLLGGDKIDLTNAAVVTFLNLLKNAGGITTFGFTNANVQELANFVDAVTSFRRRERQLGRSSFERP